MTAADPVRHWFASLGREPFAFQREAWDASARGESGLVHAPTGMGKTLAVWMGPLLDWMRRHPDRSAWGTSPEEPLRALWITPLRALAADTAEALREPVEALGIPWRVELRTGDVSSGVKARQRRKPPTALVTTPESLSLLLSYEDAAPMLAGLRDVIVDEWHELMGSKRGVQTELCLARLRALAPGLRTWGLSATLGNLPEAMATLLGPGVPGRLVVGDAPKEILVDTVIPESAERFPWSGHLGLTLLPRVIEALAAARTSLLFTNTRSQAELWHRAIVEARPDWAEDIALHHGSLEPELRAMAETRLAEGSVRAVVCTASLDLGVDFSPVEQVIQVGSPKGVARLLQRAGRSGHRPGAPSRILCVPAHAFELIEYSAAREAALRRDVEARTPLLRPLDVLVQHILTVAAGSGVDEAELLAEVRRTHAFASLADEEWRWCMEFAARGGLALRAYPDYQRLAMHGGRWRPASARTVKLHRLAIGTISSDASVRVKTALGPSYGSVEESFIARLKPGDRFLFAGRTLEFVRMADLTAVVRPAKGPAQVVPQWMGGRMPLSSRMAAGVRARLDEARRGHWADAEMQAIRPVLDIQARWSRLPAPDELLIETTRSRDGFHAFLFPFEGRLVHEGLVALLAWRLAREAPRTFGIYQTDYGIELACAEAFVPDEAGWRRVLSPERLTEDLLSCLNGTELAKRRFRDIARVAGLVFQGYPGAAKTTRQLQTSSGLLFEVFQRFDPGNLLLAQARREVLEEQLEAARLRTCLERIARMKLVVVETQRLTPFAFPIWAERLREQVTSEDWESRVRRMVERLEKEADRRPRRKKSQ
jgi:ATP-dependent Lhr-like helicase